MKTWSSSLCSFLFIRKGWLKRKETKSRLKRKDRGHQLPTHWKGHPGKNNNKKFNRLHKFIVTYGWNRLNLPRVKFFSIKKNNAIGIFKSYFKIITVQSCLNCLKFYCLIYFYEICWRPNQITILFHQKNVGGRVISTTYKMHCFKIFWSSIINCY